LFGDPTQSPGAGSAHQHRPFTMIDRDIVLHAKIVKAANIRID
jgi:hypothetical protein